MTPAERIALSYPLDTHNDWANTTGVLEITDKLDGPNKIPIEELAAYRDYFNENFDVNMMLNYITLINWGGAWDDFIHNHFLYQRFSDHKWSLVPWVRNHFCN